MKTHTPDIPGARWVIVGQIGRPYGVKGWLKIYSYTDPHTNLLQYHPLYVERAHDFQPLALNECRPHGKGLIGHIEGVDTPEAARAWTNIRLAITRDQLPALAPNQYYWTDLQGLAVYNLQQQFLGHITSLFSTGAQDILVIHAPNQPEILIPFVTPHIVKQVDLAAKQMQVDWQP